MNKVELKQNCANNLTITEHLRACDTFFVPSLSERLNIGDYADKILFQAERFEAWFGHNLVGLVAVYCNAPNKNTAFITSVSVLPSWQGKRIGAAILDQCISHVRELGFKRLELEVAKNNQPAIALYERRKFVVVSNGEDMVKMAMEYEKANK